MASATILEENKRAPQRIYDVWDGDDEAALDDVLAENVILHTPEHVGGSVQGRDAYFRYGGC